MISGIQQWGRKNPTKICWTVGIAAVAVATAVLAAEVKVSTRTFQVTSYNVLAPTYASQGGGAWYQEIDPSIMLWENRQEALIEHIRAFDSDILCLQEVEPDFFIRLQNELGYQGAFLNKAGKPGEAIFFRKPFELIGESSVVAADGRMGQIVHLKLGDKRLGILNGHLSWDELAVQADAQIQDWVAKGIKESNIDNWIICGDFNVTRETGAIRYLESIGFKRAYAGIEPSITCSVPSAAHEVDYIFTRGAFQLKATTPVRHIAGPGALPMLGEPSDHLAKSATFSL